MKGSAAWICVLQSTEGSLDDHIQGTAAIPITVIPRLFSGNLISVVLCYMLLNCAGCAYFRTGTKTYQELEQQNNEIQQEQHQWLAPGYYGSWTI